MDKKNKILIITDDDLDGAGCALLLKWFFEKDSKMSLHIKEMSSYNFASNLQKESKSFANYYKVFITDLAIPDEATDFIDKPNVVIIDHHTTHKTEYKYATALIQNYTSATFLILHKLIKDKMEFTSAQKKILAYIDDYDSYTLKYQSSLMLNAIHRTYNRPKVTKFISSFKNGIREFNFKEKNAIKLYFKGYNKEIQNKEVYQLKLGDKKIIAFFCSRAINEVIKYFMDKYKADAAVAVNLDYKVVSFRSKEDSKIDSSKLAETLCDGGGHKYAAGGKVTPKFLEFIKTFK